MLIRRPTEPRWVVLTCDPAFKGQFTQEQQRDYMLTRDLSILGDLDSLPNPVSRFKVDPMLAKYAHLKDQPAMMVMLHLLEVKDFELPPDAWEMHPNDPDKRRTLTGAAMNYFVDEAIEELGGLVVELCNADGVSTPFTPPVSLPGLAAAMNRGAALTAIRARLIAGASAESKSSEV